MNQKNYITVSKFLFAIIALAHLLRIINGWKAVFNGWTVPMWLSWLALAVTAYLAYSAMNFSKK